MKSHFYNPLLKITDNKKKRTQKIREIASGWKLKWTSEKNSSTLCLSAESADLRKESSFKVTLTCDMI